ncbi:MAG: hypothetical protein Q7S40_32835 [Opitutaceae bacterium]|nr:hypothetical protein [Opitutaceae bacterium]
MPKDEFDFDDPMELNGVGLACKEDTTAAMTECFVEEFMRLGYDHQQILSLFRNPHYIGMNLALQKRGEQFVRDVIGDVFARRGTTVTWPVADGMPGARQPKFDGPGAMEKESYCQPPRAINERDATATDPMGSPAPGVIS